MLVKIKLIIKWLMLATCICVVVMIVLAFTRIPYDMHIWLGTKDCKYKFTPEYIVFLGGSGMPSGDNLMRLYYAAVVAKKYPLATVVIVHPKDEGVIAQMKTELLLHGIDSARIVIENEGTSTREQALKIKEHFISIETKKITVITSPEYMLRSVRAFRKAGFQFVGGDAAFENAMLVDLTYNHKKVGGKAYAPDVSSNIDLRYNFWNYLKLEITCIREYIALGYYKLNGWI